MPLQTNRRSRFLYLLAGLISVLLLGNAVLMYRNSQVIEVNRQLEVEAENAKVNTVAIARNLHLLDLGIRGYALTRDSGLLTSLDSAKVYRDRVIGNVESALRKQEYHEMHKLEALRDSIESYFDFIDGILVLVQKGEDERAKELIRQDRGLTVWLQHRAFSQDLARFEDDIMRRAAERYSVALKRTYGLQLLIFLLTVPAIFYMAFYAARTFHFSDRLRLLEQDKNRTLLEQNQELDRLVAEKTKDIQTQNEEILAQNEEIRAHNDLLISQQEELQQAKLVIEQQADIIEAKNRELTQEVANQTQDLREANNELIAYNSRLEQFTYIISHNLRAPLARLKGLANVMEHTTDGADRDKIFGMIVQSSYELDSVISDLGTILNIERSNTLVKTTINVRDAIQKVLLSMKEEIEQIGARLAMDVDHHVTISCLAPYVESILHNLISNAIKYRNPERLLSISIRCMENSQFVTVEISDNGLGIDLGKHGNNLFNLYKRFHFHVEGKGLGLYLVKTQIDALGGNIQVDSAVDQGTSFAVHFPK